MSDAVNVANMSSIMEHIILIKTEECQLQKVLQGPSNEPMYPVTASEVYNLSSSVTLSYCDN